MATLPSSGTGYVRRALGIAVLLWASAALVQPAWSQVRAAKQEFPRLAGIQIGGNPYPGSHNDPDYRAAIARLDVAVLSQHASDETAIAIKQINPNILLGRYTNVIAVHQDWCCDHETWRNKIGQERGPDNQNHPDWWLRTPSGDRIEQWPGTFLVNTTDYVRPDSNGERWIDYRVAYDHDKWFRNPVWDIWYSDSVRYQPKYPRNARGTLRGGRASNSEENEAYRLGHRRHWDGIHEARPGTIVSVNFNWYLYQRATGRWDLDEYDKVVRSGLFENAMGDPSPEFDTSWHIMYQWYLWGESYLKDPTIMLFHVKGGRDDYQFARYSLASALMGNGYFKYSPDDGYHFGTVEWFDEFDLAGAGTTSWLGLALAPPPEEAWQKGVYRRDFENGVALVNPRRNGRKTVTIEPGFRRFQGNQDPAVNNGQPAREITLGDADGILLIREDAADRPAPPSSPELRLGT